MIQPKSIVQQRHQQQMVRRNVQRQQRKRHRRQDEAEASLDGSRLVPHQEISDARQQQQMMNHSLSSTSERQALVFALGQTYGNRQLNSLLHQQQGNFPVANQGVLQTQEHDKKSPTNPGGRGAGKMQGAKEEFYDVRGKHLADLLPQLKKFGEFAAQTSTPVRFHYETQQQARGKWTTTVTWQVDEATSQLPRWQDYDTASSAAQTEWDRYLQQTRLHEEAKHIEAVKEYLQRCPTSFTTKNGAKATRIAKEEEKKVRHHIQTQIHDKCGHGAEIDAILHSEHDVEE